MALRLNVGVSRKLGLPGYSSVGASCNVEVELDAGLLQNDLEGFHAQVRGAFAAARQAVDDELRRLQAVSGPSATLASPLIVHPQHNGAAVRAAAPLARAPQENGSRGRSATQSQVNAKYAISRSRGIDLEKVLHAEFGVARPDELSVRAASEFIDRLKAVTAG